MLVVTGIIEVGASSVDALKTAAAAAAAETRKEPGCREYAFFQDIENPGRFRVYEEWEDQAALTAHFSMPHMADFMAALQKAEILSSAVVKYEPGPSAPVL